MQSNNTGFTVRMITDIPVKSQSWQCKRLFHRQPMMKCYNKAMAIPTAGKNVMPRISAIQFIERRY